MPTDLLGRGDFYHLEGRNHRGPACLVPSRRAVLAFPCPLSTRFASLRRPRDTCLMGQGSGASITTKDCRVVRARQGASAPVRALAFAFTFMPAFCSAPVRGGYRRLTFTWARQFSILIRRRRQIGVGMVSRSACATTVLGPRSTRGWRARSSHLTVNAFFFFSSRVADRLDATLRIFTTMVVNGVQEQGNVRDTEL
jgi:hypothetical protein